MGISINYGTSKKKNTKVCISSINTVLSSGTCRNIILLVPEQYSSFYEQLLVEESVEQGSFYAEVLTFKRLAYRTFARSLFNSERYIDSAGKSMLMYDVVTGISDKFEAFSKAGKYPAFAGAAVKTIREFKRYGITSEQITDVSQKAGTGLLKQKLQEMALIYEEYEKKLKADGYNDADDNLSELANLIKSENEFNNSMFWIEGFDGFTPAEMEVIVALMAGSKKVTFTFCCESLRYTNESDVFAPVVKTIEKIQKNAEILNIYTENRRILSDESAVSGLPGDLEHLGTQYFNYPGAIYRGRVNGIRLYKAASIYAEVRKCALEISKSVRTGKMRYGDICVVSGLYDEYREYIDAVFSKYDIPVFLDEKRSIAKHPLASYILSVLDVYINNYSFESVMTYLKSSYTCINTDDISVLENYLRQWDIKGTGAWNDTDWDFYTDNPDNEEKLSRLNDIRRKIIADLEPFFDQLRYGIKGEAFVTALYKFLIENEIFLKLTEAAKTAEFNGRLDYSDELKQSWNFLMEILNQVFIITGNEKKSTEKYRIMLELAFSQKKIGVIPPRTDEVFAGGLNKAYGIKAKMLMILGANEPGFPTKIINEGILTDKDRGDLKLIGFEIAPDTKNQVLSSLIDTYNLLNLPGECLYVSYSETGPDGSPRRRSGFYDRAEDLFEQLNIEDSSIEEDAEYALSPITGLDMLTSCSSTADCSAIFEDGDRSADRGKGATRDRSGLERWYHENGLPFGRWDKRDTLPEYSFKSILTELLGSAVESSPTVIENYVSCPYKYFAGNALGVTERKEFSISPPDIGSIIHNILKNLVGKYLDNDNADYDNYLEEANETLEKMKIGKMFSRDDRYKYLGKRVAKRAVDSFVILKTQLEAGEFKPIVLEAAFGRGRNIVAPRFTTDDGSIYLKGRIDRIDGAVVGDEEFFRIIDYKSSDRPLKLYKVNEGLDIQLASYLMAYENHSGTKPAGMYYFTTKNKIVKVNYGFNQETVVRDRFDSGCMEGYTVARDDVIKAMDRAFEKESSVIPVKFNEKKNSYKKAMSQEEMTCMTSRISEVIENNTKKIFDCRFPVTPVSSDKKACEYCGFRGICGFDIRKPGFKFRQIKSVNDEDVVWGENGGE